MEIGSFIELQFPEGREYYSQKSDIARLNTGRAAIWHAYRITGCNAIWMPYYQCDSVRAFLLHKKVLIKYYHIGRDFYPIDLNPSDNEAVVLVNYFGIMSFKRMEALAKSYPHVIIDNCQAFFAKPFDNCLNVYSCRKFIGVPDGAYVIGKDTKRYTEEYAQSYSSDTSLFMLQRIEYGCEGKAYESRKLNEHRFETEGCKTMSKLTRTILDGTDYESIIQKRKENFYYARRLFDSMNCISVDHYYASDTVPMVYPLLIEDEEVLVRLKQAKHFQGHWWEYLQDEMPENTAENWISRYIIPITIDQRYGKEELDFLYHTVVNKR